MSTVHVDNVYMCDYLKQGSLHFISSMKTGTCELIVWAVVNLEEKIKVPSNDFSATNASRELAAKFVLAQKHWSLV